MFSKFALLSSLSLASAALATPSSQLAVRIARRRENRQSQPLSRVASPAGVPSFADYNPSWCGAVLTGGYGMFTSVTGTFTIPLLAPTDNCTASAWVGINGDTCPNAILQTGVDFSVENGAVSYDAWYEWYPDYAYDFSGISLNAGDVINATVTATSTTSGTVVIENLTTGQTATQDVTSSYALCEEDAEWIVEDFEEYDNPIPFCGFGTVTFRNATATGPGGTYSPSNATIFDIEQNGEVLTSVSTSGDTVTITYV